MNNRTCVRKIVEFDSATWWGLVETVPSNLIDFHATCYIGASTRNLPKIGDLVTVLFSDTSKQRLHSVMSFSR